MTAEADRTWQRPDVAAVKERLRRALRVTRARSYRGYRWLAEHLPFRHGFSSLTRRIVVLNLIGLAILVVYFRNRGSIAVEDINLMKG